MLISFHTLTGILALLSGLAVLVLPKGRGMHRRLGRVYVLSLVTLCIASFWIQDTTPFFRGLGTFHIMALVSLATVLAGWLPALRTPRVPGWRVRHIGFMLWSYVGLIMALNSHFFRPVLLWLHKTSGTIFISLPATVLLAWGLPLLLGLLVIPRVRKHNTADLDPTPVR